MTDILCQADHSGKGCGVCGGYKYVLVAHECVHPSCHRQYLVRPGNHTIFAGKHFTSADGLALYYPTIESGAVCQSHKETA